MSLVLIHKYSGRKTPLTFFHQFFLNAEPLCFVIIITGLSSVLPPLCIAATDLTLPAPTCAAPPVRVFSCPGNAAGHKTTLSLPPVKPNTKLQKKWASHIRQRTRSIATFVSPFCSWGFAFRREREVLVVAVNSLLLSLLKPRAPLEILLPPGAQQGQQLPRPSYKDAAEGMAQGGQGSEDRLRVWCSLETQGSGTAQPGLYPMAMASRPQRFSGGS